MKFKNKNSSRVFERKSDGSTLNIKAEGVVEEVQSLGLSVSNQEMANRLLR